jgi:hypothetical protein
MLRPNCKCIDKSNKLLAKDNVEIRTEMMFSFGGRTTRAFQSGAVIETRKIDTSKRTKKKTVYASYCPICGKKYREKKS